MGPHSLWATRTRTLSSIWSSTVHSRFCACDSVPFSEMGCAKIELNFADTIQFSAARGPFGRHGRHPARVAGRYGATLCPSHVADRLGCGPALAGVVEGRDRGNKGTREREGGEQGSGNSDRERRTRERNAGARQRNAGCRPAAYCFDARVEAASVDREDRSRDQCVAPRAAGSELRCGCRFAGRNPVRRHRAPGWLPAPHWRGQAARMARAMAVYRARAHARRARDRAGCGAGIGRGRRCAHARGAVAARRSRGRKLVRCVACGGVRRRTAAHRAACARRRLGRQALAARALRSGRRGTDSSADSTCWRTLVPAKCTSPQPSWPAALQFPSPRRCRS